MSFPKTHQHSVPKDLNPRKRSYESRDARGSEERNSDRDPIRAAAEALISPLWFTALEGHSPCEPRSRCQHDNGKALYDMHSLRVTLATHLRKQGSLGIMRDILGQSSIGRAAHYDAGGPETLREELMQVAAGRKEAGGGTPRNAILK